MALKTDPSWWCPSCRAGRTGDACIACGLLAELAPRDPGLRPEPVIEDVTFRGFIVQDEVPERERLPGSEWPWMSYLAIATLLVVMVRVGALSSLGQWLAPLLVLAFLGFVALTIFRRQALVTFGQRYLSALGRRERHRYHLRVQNIADESLVDVTIDSPRPWPPLGPDTRRADGTQDDLTLRQGDFDATLTFVGGWHSEQHFIADRIVPPAITGRPIVIASGHAQPLLWVTGLLGAVVLIRALL